MTTGVEVSKPSMEIRFQPGLYCRKSSTPSLKRRNGEGDPTYYKENFTELADPIYEKFTLDDRLTGVQANYIVFVRHLGVFRHHPRRVQ